MGKLIILVLVISVQFCWGQNEIVLVEASTKRPIVNQTVLFRGDFVYTDIRGVAKIPERIKKLIINDLIFKSMEIDAPFPDTLFLEEKKVEYKPVTISRSNYKVPKLIKRKNKSTGSFYKNSTYYMKASLNTLKGKVTALKLMVSSSNLMKVTGDVKIKVEIRKVNYGWADTSKALADLNYAQFGIFNKIPEKNKASVGEVVFVKYIPINEIKTDFIEIPIESITEDEVFIAIGLNSEDEMKEGTRGIFRAQKFNSFNIAYDYGDFNCPHSYLNAKYFVSEPDQLMSPYFELIVK